MTNPLEENEFFARQVARLLIVLYTCGEPVTDLIDGETRQIEPRSLFARLDFWVREPGHLALALVHAYGAGKFDEQSPLYPVYRAALDRMTTDSQADSRRVALLGGSAKPYRFGGELDSYLSFLSSRGLVSDRPSFDKSGRHRIVLETAGIQMVTGMLEKCPSMRWYQTQAVTVKTFLPMLEDYDLTIMPYLGGGLSPLMASDVPLLPMIQERYSRLTSR